MAKYDWKQLEKEYILSDHKSVSSFLKDKEIKQNSNTFRHTKGWKNKKAEKVEKKGSKTIEKVIEKVIEKESEKEAQRIVDIRTIANDLALKVIEAKNELNMHLVTSKSKTKKVEYDIITHKLKNETINETEEIKSYIDIIDRKGLKELTSALKDLNDILIISPQLYELKKEKLELERKKEEKDNW